MSAPAASLLFLYGNDEYAISRRLEAMQTRLDKGGMNTVRLEGAKISMDELAKAVNAAPFLGEKRLVFIANPSAASSLPKKREELLRFLLAAPPTTQVVLYEVLMDKRDRERHWLVRRAEAGEIKAEAHLLPSAGDMSTWIMKETKARNGSMEPAAAAILAEMVGEDTRTAAQEIEKLLMHAANSRPITLADVNAVSIVSAQGSIFALVDAMAEGKTGAAQKMLYRLLQDEDPMALWGMVIRQFRLLLQAREVLDRGGTAMEFQKALNVHEFVARKICTQAKHFTLPALERIYHRLLEMDEGAKTSQVPLDLALDLLIVELSGR